jgi:hypothetical protein
MIAAKMADMKSGARTDLGSNDTRSITDAASQLNVSEPRQQVSLADAIDEALESGEAVQQRVENSQRVCIATCNTGVDVAEVDRWRKLRAIPEDARQD